MAQLFTPLGLVFFLRMVMGSQEGGEGGSQFGNDGFSQSSKTKFLFRLQFPPRTWCITFAEVFPRLQAGWQSKADSLFHCPCAVGIFMAAYNSAPVWVQCTVPVCFSDRLRNRVPVLLSVFGPVGGCS